MSDCCDDPRALDIRWFERRNGDHTYVLVGTNNEELARFTIQTHGKRKAMTETLDDAKLLFAVALNGVRSDVI